MPHKKTTYQGPLSIYIVNVVRSLYIQRGVLCIRGRDTQMFTATKKPRSEFRAERVSGQLVSKATNQGELDLRPRHGSVTFVPLGMDGGSFKRGGCGISLPVSLAETDTGTDQHVQ